MDIGKIIRNTGLELLYLKMIKFNKLNLKMVKEFQSYKLTKLKFVIKMIKINILIIKYNKFLIKMVILITGKINNRQKVLNQKLDNNNKLSKIKDMKGNGLRD